MFGAQAEINLGNRSGVEIKAEVFELADVFQGVGPGGDRLCLLSLDLVEEGGRQLARHDPFQVVFDVEDVDQDQTLAAAPQDQDAAVGPPPERQEALAGTGNEVERSLGVEVDELAVDLDPVGVVLQLGHLFPDNPGLGQAQGLGPLDEGQGIAAGQKIADADVVDGVAHQVRILDDRDLLGHLGPQAAGRGFRVLTAAVLGDLNQEFLAQLVALALDVGLPGILGKELIGTVHLIDLHARGGLDQDVVDVDAQGDPDDGLGHRETLEKEVLLAELGRPAGEEIEQDKRQNDGFMMIGQNSVHALNLGCGNERRAQAPCPTVNMGRRFRSLYDIWGLLTDKRTLS